MLCLNICTATISMYIYLLFLISELTPTEQYLQRLFIKKYARSWRKIGLQLNVDTAILDIINSDFVTEEQARCKTMLREWLKKEPMASCEKLFQAAQVADKNYNSAETADTRCYCVKDDTGQFHYQ